MNTVISIIIALIIAGFVLWALRLIIGLIPLEPWIKQVIDVPDSGADHHCGMLGNMAGAELRGIMHLSEQNEFNQHWRRFFFVYVIYFFRRRKRASIASSSSAAATSEMAASTPANVCFRKVSRISIRQASA